MKKLALVAALLGSVVMTSHASAATLFYSLSPKTGENSFTFSLNTVNAFRYSLSAGFVANISDPTLNNVSVDYTPNVLFFDRSIGGGLSFRGNQYSGPELFLGSTTAPAYLTGIFETSGGILTVTDLTAAVPEPSTWAMMLVGFGLIGATARYRRRTMTVTYA